MKPYFTPGLTLCVAVLLAAAIPLAGKAQAPGQPPPLPHLSAVRQFGTVYLQWSVPEECPSVHFTVERTANRVQHTEIASFARDGAAPEPTRYAYIEPFEPEGTVWYRLKVSDRTGQVYYSPYARSADTLSAKRLGVKPSPGPGHRVQLTLQHPPDVPVLVTIEDRLGFTHYRRWHQPDALLTVHFEDTTRSLPPGVYSASVSVGQLFLREKFIVE